MLPAHTLLARAHWLSLSHTRVTWVSHLPQGREAAFEKRWAERKSSLGLLKGFRFFGLLRRVDVTGAEPPGFESFVPAVKPVIDETFTLKEQELIDLTAQLESEPMTREVCKNAGNGCEGARFAGHLFQPLPYSPEKPRGMPTQFEPFFESKEHVIVNVPPPMMFKAKIFTPSRLCAVYALSMPKAPEEAVDSSSDATAEFDVRFGDAINYLSMTIWEEEANFEVWRKGSAFKEAHGGGTLGGIASMLMATAINTRDIKPAPEMWDGLLPCGWVQPKQGDATGWRSVAHHGENVLPGELFLAMNRMKFQGGYEAAFEQAFEDSTAVEALASTRGFKGFLLLRHAGPERKDGITHATMSLWTNGEAYAKWRDSDASEKWPSPMVWPPQVFYEVILTLEPPEGAAEAAAHAATAAAAAAAPPSKCGTEGGRRALSHAGTAVRTGDDWSEEWTRRISCWWMSLPGPTQGQLGGCLGALSLHISSRLDAAAAAAGLRSAAAREPAAAGSGCEWVGRGVERLRLPSFPAFPTSDSSFILPPIPRLMPSWERLQVLKSSPQYAALAPPQESDVSVAASVGAGAAIGFGLAALVLLGAASLSTRGARPQLRRGNAIREHPVSK